MLPLGAGAALWGAETVIGLSGCGRAWGEGTVTGLSGRGRVAVFMDSERRNGEPPSQPLAQDDRAQIEHKHQGYEQQGGGEYHRPRGVGIRRLESEVVDVEAEMHELLLQ